MNAPILSIPSSHDKFHLECDTSKYAVRAVLSQHQDNKWKPIGYVLKVFSPTQQNYEIYNQELLVIMILLLGDFQKHLMTAQQEFKIWTDHVNLQYFKKPQQLNCCQA
jgi:hypothetical protein